MNGNWDIAFNNLDEKATNPSSDCINDLTSSSAIESNSSKHENCNDQSKRVHKCQESGKQHSNRFNENRHYPKRDSKNEVTKAMPLYLVSNLFKKKDPTEVLLTILSKESGFLLHLEKRGVSHDVMSYILLAIEIALDSKMHSNVAAMISQVTNSNLFFSKLTIFLAAFQRYPSEKFHLDSLFSLSKFLFKFQAALPSNASDPVQAILPTLEKTCDLFLSKNAQLFKKVSNILQEIKKQKNLFFTSQQNVPEEQISQTQKDQEPPDNYRSIPILPTANDIHTSCTFLRPNLVKGQYKDTEHYLDVQYRLLREDYVKPLRDGIASYLNLKKQGKSLNCKEIRVYSNVHIIRQEFVNGGLVHFAHFKENNFSKIKWELSKRFLTGSLLCLSSNDFETMLFATVARRDPKELCKGLVLLRFEDLTDEVLTLSPLRNFVVIETNAYFEAYRHNLHALCELEETKLPMKPYIIETQNTIRCPQYLQESTVYDMRPLLLPLEEHYFDRHVEEDGEISITYNFSYVISQKATAVRILEDDQWPTYSELSLDPTQYAAIKAAVTKEFAIVQGPPGTGKTYVGLRIAQLLLHNKNKWQTQTNASPMLVVCYTNHALDQFLEGLSFFTQKIVRIGGRGTNEKISHFQLSNLRRKVVEKREIPNYIFKFMRQKRFELHNLAKDIAEIKRIVEQCYSTILGEDVLKDYMSFEHYYSIKNVDDVGSESSKMQYWLGILGRKADQCPTIVEEKDEMPTDLESKNGTSAKCFKEEENEGAVDIEFIEAQRDINSEEFDIIRFDMLSNENKVLHLESDSWKYQGGKKKIKDVADNLNDFKAMSETEVKSIDNVWFLPHSDRWGLYKYWLECYIEKKQRAVFDMQIRLRKEYEEFNEVQTEIDLFVSLRAHVIGMTTTGAAKYRNILQRLDPKIVIVEEAAEILESHVVTSLASNTQHVILIGDHQQLKPSPAVHMLAVKYELDVSLFERMVQNGMQCYRLGIQHRMRPEISALLVPHIYENLKDHESVREYENIKGINKNVFFISHNYNELQEFDSRSKVNLHEATFLIKFCSYILLQGYDSSQITVLTTYSGQYYALKKLIGDGILKKVKLTVVDNYQGEENDIILISFVRSNEEGEIGFLKVSNRVCVALSRAKKALYCIGNFELLMENSSLWKDIVGVLQKNEAIGPSLQLSCQNHPETINLVANEKDFDIVREGGCSHKCAFILPCKHECSLLCHPYDTKHEKIKCLKPCSRSCNKGHLCKKNCSEVCGFCTELIEKKMELCGHVIIVECYLSLCEEIICTEPCEKILSCGHLCQRTCNAPCTTKCSWKVDVVSDICGHMVEVECYNSSNSEYISKLCKKPCGVKLSCGHSCRGTCSTCHQGKLHVTCNQICKRTLICGHKCQVPCCRNCPPCILPCENQCFHGKCTKKCGDPCIVCEEACKWECPHKKCTAVCGDICKRDVCDEPCPKLLECQHSCPGFCEELCPKMCIHCDKDSDGIYFGNKDNEVDRFIVLEDCGHMIEVSYLTKWLNPSCDEGKKIELKVCPKCKTVIRRNSYFGNIIKSGFSEIEKVKIAYKNLGKDLKLQKSVIELIDSKSDKVKAICEPLKKSLIYNKNRHTVEIIRIENIVHLTEALINATEFFNTFSHEINIKDLQIQILFNNLMKYMSSCKILLIEFIQCEYLTASQDQLEDLKWEIHRLKLADQLLKFMGSHNDVSHTEAINAINCIASYTPFRESNVKTFIEIFRNLALVSGATFIEDFDMENQMKLKLMNLSEVHWYQCLNGHVYCITEEREKRRCFDCEEKNM
ncbi:NFX1-type zinc finger-containing protein 1 [Caerostris darwini]|uniref:NFX1-type zinc finger-containing protein 1 n=1 Tax=Caerostris darwini TaxID=1538125 RepID=A0AAV4UQW7_9ARAC|nr:NFX1-type zinc finger-containing protein 1 [Caerostris darwini]